MQKPLARRLCLCACLCACLGLGIGLYLAGVAAEAAAPAADPANDTAARSPADEGDVRVELVRRQLRRDDLGALERVRELLEAGDGADEAGVDAALRPDLRRRGLPYLEAHLELRLGRAPEAIQGFADAMASVPELEPWSRYRLARLQEDLGHPEVAAGLVASLLGSDPPPSLLEPAVDLLRRAVSAGGDCRLLRSVRSLRLDAAERRRLEVVRAECRLRVADREDSAAWEAARRDARERLLALLDEASGDDAALEAARRLAPSLDLRSADARTLLRVGFAFFEHREFRVALRHLAGALVKIPSTPGISASEAHRVRYALARSQFWLGRWDSAARAFASVAASAPDAERRVQALYQQARSLELSGRSSWRRAAAVFESVARLQPRSSWAAAARISEMRLLWLLGEETTAVAIYDDLVRRRQLAIAERAALFLAVSVIGEEDAGPDRLERARRWLVEAARHGRGESREIHHWRGRLETAADRLPAAVDAHLRAVAEDPHHPFGLASLRALASPPLADLAAATARRRAGSYDADDLLAAWALLSRSPSAVDRAAASAARRRLETRLRADDRTVPYLDLRALPVESWPLWDARLDRPEEKLLALGLFEEGSPAVLRHFPVAEPSLAYTGSLALSRTGATHRSLYVAEVLARRIPSSLPADLLPRGYRELLYPFRFSFLILRETRRRGVDPFLLAAIIREESRYDPGAFSGASARGLTQFVFPTAARLAAEIEWEDEGLVELEPWDLHRPEVSVTLGAAYLEELSARFGGSEAEMVAAYNAGEPQAELWRSYCVGQSLEEFLTKVAFRETRGYVAKVLRSRSHYRDLYGRLDAPEPGSETAAPAPPASGPDGDGR